MNIRQLSSISSQQILSRLAHSGSTSETTIEELIADGSIPADFKWQPALCVRRGDETILVHVLVSPEFPVYLEKLIKEKLRPSGYSNVHILIFARDMILEAAEDRPPAFQPAPYSAAAVAESAITLGCALAFEAEDAVHLVFDHSYAVPRRCRTTAKETGHIPKWLYQQIAASTSFSTGLQKLLKKFALEYERATRRSSITNDREAGLLLDFAKSFAKLDKRLFLPVEQLETLRQFEMSRAVRSRDHFFHTFNNLFLGFSILGQLSGGKKVVAEVDKFIASDDPSTKLNAWEVLWFLTCLFHDPGYTAEKFWANFRFTFGVVAGDTEEEDIPDQVKEQIRDLWNSEFAAPRRDLHDLYNRTIRRWTPPSIARQGADLFDNAVQQAYFDGNVASHSLVSGLRLINSCRSQDVPRPNAFSLEMALAACEIAALCMMFHDPRCRSILQRAGIPPIAFESLPYATVLMYVDCLQDDRRDISISRFKRHGVLASVGVDATLPCVRAEVCLAEVPVRGWPGRIAEYESVMAWINKKSSARFTIEYRSKPNLPR